MELTDQTTDNLLKQLLTTKTSVSLLDSGDAYGRLWEQNQKRNFDNKQEVSLEFLDGELDYITVSTYHYLSKILRTNDISKEINKILEQLEIEQLPDLEDKQEALEAQITQATGCVVEFEGNPINTYNYDSSIDQILQYQILKLPNKKEMYVLLQIHQGCDVRGGYTEFCCFKLESWLNPNPIVKGEWEDTPVECDDGGTMVDGASDEIIETSEIKEGDDIKMEISAVGIERDADIIKIIMDED